MPERYRMATGSLPMADACSMSRHWDARSPRRKGRPMRLLPGSSGRRASAERTSAGVRWSVSGAEHRVLQSRDDETEVTPLIVVTLFFLSCLIHFAEECSSFSERSFCNQ